MQQQLSKDDVKLVNAIILKASNSQSISIIIKKTSNATIEKKKSNYKVKLKNYPNFEFTTKSTNSKELNDVMPIITKQYSMNNGI
jgi:hypothetical protein